MPILLISNQPGNGVLRAAYRPVFFSVNAQRTDGQPIPPVVYCDIYVNDVFYKTSEKTLFAQSEATYSVWQFDIQDAVQEVFKRVIPPNGGFEVVDAKGLVKVFCKFRSSGYDADGFIVPEGIPPVQGTGTKQPVAGSGTLSNSFYAANAILQHENNQNLAEHLSHYKSGVWQNNAYPLTHRPLIDHAICINQSEYFPIAYLGTDQLSCIRLNYRFKGLTSFQSITKCESDFTCNQKVIDVEVDVIAGQFVLNWTNTTAQQPGDTFHFFVSMDGGETWQPLTVDSSYDTTATVLDDLVVNANYKFRVTPVCSNGIDGISGTVDYTGSVAPCIPVAIAGAPNLPDATEGQAYAYTFSLFGDAPFYLNVITKPSWMNIALSGTSISFSGTPAHGDVTDGVPANVVLQVSNCTGSSTASFSDTVDVHAASPSINTEVVNNHPGYSINSVSGMMVIIGSFPVEYGIIARGFIGSGLQIIKVAIAENEPSVGSLILKINGSVNQTRPVSSSGIYSFHNYNYNASDSMEIIIEP